MNLRQHTVAHLLQTLFCVLTKNFNSIKIAGKFIMAHISINSNFAKQLNASQICEKKLFVITLLQIKFNK